MKDALLILVLFLSSCSGYKFKTHGGPFETLNIKTIAIPMFVNHTVLNDVSGPFTKEFSLLFTKIKGIKVQIGKNKADAILLGIIQSNEYSKRNKFYLPLTSQMSLQLRVVLLRAHASKLAQVMQSEYGKLIKKHPKIIFDKTIPLKYTFTRSLYDNLSVDRGGVVNFTKNKYFQSDGIKKMAQIAAMKLEEEIINAF
jgi:hypothetical protein